MAEFLQYCVFYLLRSLDHEGNAAKIVGHRNLKASTGRSLAAIAVVPLSSGGSGINIVPLARLCTQYLKYCPGIGQG